MLLKVLHCLNVCLEACFVEATQEKGASRGSLRFRGAVRTCSRTIIWRSSSGRLRKFTIVDGVGNATSGLFYGKVLEEVESLGGYSALHMGGLPTGRLCKLHHSSNFGLMIFCTK